ncbi:hypothetical protein [Arthrobacter bambusae]|uniref:hypothetical protein n=1 Tax=Arthrobacter bambusae TaxID=1338426 RepID=UPI003394B25A
MDTFTFSRHRIENTYEHNCLDNGSQQPPNGGCASSRQSSAIPGSVNLTPTVL